MQHHYQLISEGVALWQRQIFQRLFGLLAVICVPVYVTSVYLCWQLQLWSMIVLDSYCYVLLLVVLFAERLPQYWRYVLGCSLSLQIGLAFLWAVGPAGAGFMWLYATAPLAAIFLGYRASLFAQLITLFGLFGIGVSYHLGLVRWPNLAEFNAPIWWVLVINFAATNAIVSFSVSYLIEQLMAALV